MLIFEFLMMFIIISNFVGKLFFKKKSVMTSSKGQKILSLDFEQMYVFFFFFDFKADVILLD